MEASNTGGGQITSLTEAECHQLLRDSSVGRIGWNSQQGQIVLPVVYAIHEGIVVFRTSSDGILASLSSGTEAAFEIDKYDEVAKSGWSVLVHGVTRTPKDPQELVRLWSHDTPVPWVDGERNLFICLAPQRVTGRLVSSYE